MISPVDRCSLYSCRRQLDQSIKQTTCPRSGLLDSKARYFPSYVQDLTIRETPHCCVGTSYLCGHCTDILEMLDLRREVGSTYSVHTYTHQPRPPRQSRGKRPPRRGEYMCGYPASTEGCLYVRVTWLHTPYMPTGMAACAAFAMRCLGASELVGFCCGLVGMALCL